MCFLFHYRLVSVILAALPHIVQMTLKVVQLSLFGLHLMSIYVCSLLTHFHELGCCLTVVLLILGIHFLKLLVTGHYILHRDPLPLGSDVGLPFFSESIVEFSLSAKVIVLFRQPSLLFIEIVLPSRCYLVANPMGMHCLG